MGTSLCPQRIRTVAQKNFWIQRAYPNADFDNHAHQSANLLDVLKLDIKQNQMSWPILHSKKLQQPRSFKLLVL